MSKGSVFTQTSLLLYTVPYLDEMSALLSPAIILRSFSAGDLPCCTRRDISWANDSFNCGTVCTKQMQQIKEDLDMGML